MGNLLDISPPNGTLLFLLLPLWYCHSDLYRIINSALYVYSCISCAFIVLRNGERLKNGGRQFPVALSHGDGPTLTQSGRLTCGPKCLFIVLKCVCDWEGALYSEDCRWAWPRVFSSTTVRKHLFFSRSYQILTNWRNLLAKELVLSVTLLFPRMPSIHHRHKKKNQ